MTWPWPPTETLPVNRRNAGRYVCLVAFGVGIAGVYLTAIRELEDKSVKDSV